MTTFDTLDEDDLRPLLAAMDAALTTLTHFRVSGLERAI